MAQGNEWRQVDANMWVRLDNRVRLVRGLGFWAVYLDGQRMVRYTSLLQAKQMGARF